MNELFKSWNSKHFLYAPTENIEHRFGKSFNRNLLKAKLNQKCRDALKLISFEKTLSISSIHVQPLDDEDDGIKYEDTDDEIFTNADDDNSDISDEYEQYS